MAAEPRTTHIPRPVVEDAPTGLINRARPVSVPGRSVPVDLSTGRTAMAASAVSIVSGLAAAARHGILVKGGVYLEEGRKLRWLALDKTGTITHGKPAQTDFVAWGHALASDSRSIAASLVARSDHPVSKAVAQAAQRDGVALLDVAEFNALPGRGDPNEAGMHRKSLMQSVDKSLSRLGVDYIDLYLIHWPNPSVNRYLDSWQAMIELKDDLGKGVSSEGDLTRWVQQGVFLLNRHLTTDLSEPGAHSNLGWAQFTDRVIAVLNRQVGRNLVAILWGNQAQELKGALCDCTVITSAHPSPLSARRGFFGSKPYSNANAALVSAGLSPVDWSC